MPWWRTHYHLVWAVQGRPQVLVGERADIVEAALRRKTHEISGLVHAVAVQPDHVHLAVSLPPTWSIASAIKELKGASSFLVRRRDQSLVEMGFQWQAEYGVTTFSQRGLPQVVDYLRHQGERHAAQRVWEALERVESPVSRSDPPGPNDT